MRICLFSFKHCLGSIFSNPLDSASRRCSALLSAMWKMSPAFPQLQCEHIPWASCTCTSDQKLGNGAESRLCGTGKSGETLIIHSHCKTRKIFLFLVAWVENYLLLSFGICIGDYSKISKSKCNDNVKPHLNHPPVFLQSVCYTDIHISPLSFLFFVSFHFLHMVEYMKCTNLKCTYQWIFTYIHVDQKRTFSTLHPISTHPRNKTLLTRLTIDQICLFHKIVCSNLLFSLLCVSVCSKLCF